MDGGWVHMQECMKNSKNVEIGVYVCTYIITLSFVTETEKQTGRMK